MCIRDRRQAEGGEVAYFVAGEVRACRVVRVDEHDRSRTWRGGDRGGVDKPRAGPLETVREHGDRLERRQRLHERVAGAGGQERVARVAQQLGEPRVRLRRRTDQVEAVGVDGTIIARGDEFREEFAGAAVAPGVSGVDCLLYTSPSPRDRG